LVSRENNTACDVAHNESPTISDGRPTCVRALTLPYGSHRALAGKLVIDTNNCYPERGGHIPELDSESITTVELIVQHEVGAEVDVVR